MSYIKNYNDTESRNKVPIRDKKEAVSGGILEGFDRAEKDGNEPIFVDSMGTSELMVINGDKENKGEEKDVDDVGILPLNEIFKQGSDISTKTWQEMVLRQAKIEEKEDDLSKPPTKLLINLKAGGLAGGIDIFEGPPIYGNENNGNENAPENSILGQINKKIKEENLIPPDIVNIENDERNLFVLLTELNRTDFMMHESILDSYRDFLLCDNFLYLMKNANVSTVHTYDVRVLFSAMTKKVRFVYLLLLLLFY